MDVLGEDITDEMREKREVSKAMQKSHQMRKDAEMDPTKIVSNKPKVDCRYAAYHTRF